VSKEKFINGKHDDGHHDGRYASVRHFMETEEQLKEYNRKPFVIYSFENNKIADINAQKKP